MSPPLVVAAQSVERGPCMARVALTIMPCSWRALSASPRRPARRIEHGVGLRPGMLLPAMGAAHRRCCNVRQTVEAVLVRVDADRNQLLRRRAADHDRTHGVLHVDARKRRSQPLNYILPIGSCGSGFLRARRLVMGPKSGVGAVVRATRENGERPEISGAPSSFGYGGIRRDGLCVCAGSIVFVCGSRFRVSALPFDALELRHADFDDLGQLRPCNGRTVPQLPPQGLNEFFRFPRWHVAKSRC